MDFTTLSLTLDSTITFEHFSLWLQFPQIDLKANLNHDFTEYACYGTLSKCEAVMPAEA
jgi:hypothetical protein